jgi:hypothetical protein
MIQAFNDEQRTARNHEHCAEYASEETLHLP